MYPDDAPRAERIALLCEQQGHRCCYCGVRFSPEMPDDIRLYFDPRPSVEHVIRIADGGERSWWNEVAACRGCNSARGDMPPEAFYQLVSTCTIEQMRRALRTSASPKRRSAHSLRAESYKRLNRHFGKGWPPKLEEVATTPGRQAYFDMVYGIWAND